MVEEKQGSIRTKVTLPAAASTAATVSNESIDHDQYFHQTVIGRCASGLQHKNIFSAHILKDLK